MSIATMNAPDLDDVTMEELTLIRRIRERQKASSIDEYRRSLIARVEHKGDPAKKPPIAGGTYRQYRLAAGRHNRYDMKDLETAREQSKENKKALGGNTDTVSPPVHVFIPGDLITPETDGEALMMDQDNNKFRPVGQGQQVGESIDELMAEINRLKQAQSRAEDLDAREKALSAREEELKKGGKK